MYSETSIVIYLLLFIAVIIAVFVLLREFNCWYWKINERINRQNEIISLLKKLAEKSENPESGR